MHVVQHAGASIKHRTIVMQELQDQQRGCAGNARPLESDQNGMSSSMSLRLGADDCRRGAPDDGPLEPKSLSL